MIVLVPISIQTPLVQLQFVMALRRINLVSVQIMVIVQLLITVLAPMVGPTLRATFRFALVLIPRCQQSVLDTELV